MKELLQHFLGSPARMGVSWMSFVIVLFLLTMLVNIGIPSWLWLILLAPGFALAIAHREPEGFVGELGMKLYHTFNIAGDREESMLEDIREREKPDNILESQKALGEDSDEQISEDADGPEPSNDENKP